MRKSFMERAFEKILVDQSGCLLWTAPIHGRGYAKMYGTHEGVQKYHTMHRVMYERVNGTISDGLVIDHLCRVRHCVNSRHMELVTNKENILRGESFSAVNARKTHCPKGHPLDGETGDRRYCKTCNRERWVPRSER